MYLTANTNTSTGVFDYPDLYSEFNRLLALNDLDQRILEEPALVENFEKSLQRVISDSFEAEPGSPASLLLLHRILYAINRLKFFWYDELENYKNEDSVYLLKIRNLIESKWQSWESDNLNHTILEPGNLEEVLRERVTRDLGSEDTDESLYFRNEMNENEYCKLLAIASLDGLVEASQLSRTLGGTANEIQSMVTRIFLEEYGGGQLRRKHSSFFLSMLEEFGMNTKPEFYLNLVPWEVLANINHSFFLCDKKRYFLRYIGGLLYTEVSVPSSFVNFRLAGSRLGLSKTSIEYWDLHIKEDIKHGQWMLDDVALPLANQYKENAWEILLGYDQQRFFSSRVGKAVVKSIKMNKDDCSIDPIINAISSK